MSGFDITNCIYINIARLCQSVLNGVAPLDGLLNCDVHWNSLPYWR